MKHLLFASLFFVSLSLKSQTYVDTPRYVMNAPVGTTSELYTYITKGYITTFTQAQDIKRGYGVYNLATGPEFGGSWTNNKYKFVFQAFHPENAKNRILAVAILMYTNGTVTKVFCLPTPGSDEALMSNFLTDLNSLYNDQKAQLLSLMSQVYVRTLINTQVLLEKRTGR